MKKHLFILLAIVLALVMLVACSNGDDGEELDGNINGGEQDATGLPHEEEREPEENWEFSLDALIVDERFIGRWDWIGFLEDDTFVDISEGNYASRTWIFFDDGLFLNDYDYDDWALIGSNVFRVEYSWGNIDFTFELSGDTLHITSPIGRAMLGTYTRVPSFLDGQSNDLLIGRWEMVDGAVSDEGGQILVFFPDGKVAATHRSRSSDGEMFMNISEWGVGGNNRDELFSFPPGGDSGEYLAFLTYLRGVPFRISDDRLYVTGETGRTRVFQKVSASEPVSEPDNASFLLGRWYCDDEFFPEFFFLPDAYVIYHEAFGTFEGRYAVVGDQIRIRFYAYPDTDWTFSFDGHVLTMVLEHSGHSWSRELTRDPNFDPFNYDPSQLPILTREGPAGR